MKGLLKIFKENEKSKELITQENLIVYTGREAILPILLKTNNNNITPKSNWSISFWSLGGGGLLDPTDPTTRIIPTPHDTDLNQPYSLFNPSVPNTTSNGRYRGHTTVSFIRDTVQSNRYLICIVTLRVGNNELNNVPINEAGLYLSNSNSSSNASQFILFSKTTFNSIYKTNAFSLLLTWYLYV